MNHIHACPQCYEYVPCAEGCTIEPDLGTIRGTPMSNHEVCQACTKASLSPAENLIVKTLAAWLDWSGTAVLASDEDSFGLALGDMLVDDGWADPEGEHCASDKGRDLLDRARKAGVL